MTPERLAGERWFAAKGRDVDGIETVDAIGAGGGTLAIVDVHFADGAAERYALPEGTPLWGPLLARLVDGPVGGFRFDTLGSKGLPDGAERALERDQSNSSYVLGGDVIVKCYRRLWPGVHPEVELVAFLGERFAGVPAALGSLHHVDASGHEWAVALVQEYVPEAEDGWGWCRALVEDVRQGAAVDPSWASAVGSLTAELHGALSELGTREASAEELGARRKAAEGEVDRIAALAGRETAARLRERACPLRPAGSGPAAEPRPRRLPRRSDPARAGRLRRDRLRGRAHPAPGGAAGARLPAPRRRLDAALDRPRAALGDAGPPGAARPRGGAGQPRAGHRSSRRTPRRCLC